MDLGPTYVEVVTPESIVIILASRLLRDVFYDLRVPFPEECEEPGDPHGM